MNSIYLQRECVGRLQPGCADDREQRLRAVLGVCEKAGQIARQARSESFCHASEPLEKAKFEAAAGDLLFWLMIACQFYGTDLENVASAMVAKLTGTNTLVIKPKEGA